MKNSEPIIYEYLTNWTKSIRYEVAVGSAKPDFSLWDTSDRCLAFWDVADREKIEKDVVEVGQELRQLTQPFTVSGTGKNDSISYIENKIRRKSSQFSKCGSVPGMLVLPEWTGMLNLSAGDVQTAFEGWPQIRLSLGSTHTPITFARKLDGRMVDPRYSELNNSISAIALVRRRNIDSFRCGLEFAKDQFFRRYGFSESTIAAVEKIKRNLERDGFDLETETTCLEIFRNSHAKHPWPNDLHGPFDQVFDLFSQSEDPVLVYDGLAACVELEIPVSSSQSEIDTLMRDPQLRNG